MCTALKNNSTLKYLNKLASQNPMSVSGRNWHDSIHLSQDISMIGMTVKQEYSEQYNIVSDEETDNVCILREIIEIMAEFDKCNILKGMEHVPNMFMPFDQYLFLEVINILIQIGIFKQHEIQLFKKYLKPIKEQTFSATLDLKPNQK